MNQQHGHSAIKIALLTTLALLAFAANSVLCRYALHDGEIDAASFTVFRLLAGSIVLLFIIGINRQRHSEHSTVKGSWSASLMLFIYACSFSYAYTTLETGLGALILFGSVQISMILLSLKAGHTLHTTEWLGIIIAFTGFSYLLWPDTLSPPITGLFLMIVSGLAWALYSVRGQGSQHPLLDTAYNFLRTLPFIALLAILSIEYAHYSYQGLALAIVSGGITSAFGYVIWYNALSGLSAAQAAVVQLLVPVIATVGGIVFLSEIFTPRFAIASVMILGGIFIVIVGRYYFVSLRVKP